MGIGRRTFLKILGSAICSSAVFGLDNAIILEDRYVHPKLGLSFLKPATWNFIPKEYHERIREGQLKVYEERGAIVGDLLVPLMNISEDIIEFTPHVFTPGISVYKDAYKEKGYNSIYDYCDTLVNMDHMFKDFRVLSGTANFSVSRSDAVKYYAEFLYETTELIKATMVRMLEVVIEQDEDKLYRIQMFDSPQTGINRRETFDRFIGSLLIV